MARGIQQQQKSITQKQGQKKNLNKIRTSVNNNTIYSLKQIPIILLSYKTYTMLLTVHTGWEQAGTLCYPHSSSVTLRML